MRQFARPDPAAALAADTLAAVRDAFILGFGTRLSDPHPLAASAGSVGFVGLAEEVLSLAHGPGAVPPRGGDGFGTVISAMSTADYPSIISETARGIAADRRAGILDDILALTSQLELPSFAAQSYSVVDLEGLPPPAQANAHEYHLAKVRLTGETIQTHALFAKILISRQALANDDRGFLIAAVAAFLSAAHRNEMGMLTGLLEANANLQDGAPLFAAGTGNLVTAPLDATGLGSAVAALRKQPTEGGDPSDAAAAAILVHADDEAAALRLVETLPEPRRPRVVSTARLTDATRWYVLADPAVYPVIGRVRTVGADPSAVSFGGFEPATALDATTGEVREYPGVALPATHSVGYSVLSRVGAVRCDKT